LKANFHKSNQKKADEISSENIINMLEMAYSKKKGLDCEKK